MAATQGRAVDHIGFEVKNLEAFTKKLESQGIKLAVPYRQVPALGIAIAFITDPWGTYIELTEGLDKVKWRNGESFVGEGRLRHARRG